MSRKVWIHLRHLIRRSAWLLASFSSFVFLFAGASQLLRSLGDAESVAVLHDFMLVPGTVRTC